MTLSPYLQEVAKRRTFAIISHPDAGKTTITEKVLLFGQAIQTAGTVKGRGSNQHAKSDWMEMEKQRGISITTSVMQFPYHDCLVNLLDTPGHEDFSEDTYRTLTAVDCCLMVIDAAKGVEDRTRKLMEVTRLRDTPILTFMNKLDRDIRDPMELLDEVEKAHPDVFNILLQVLDDGRLTDGQGRTVDFRNTVVIMTSNLGSDLIQERFGELDYAHMKELVLGVVSHNFRPEFINRIDEVVVFHPLGEQHIASIAQIQLKRLYKRLEERGYEIHISDEALKLLSENGYDPVYGARPLKRAIQQQIENPLAQQILSGELVPGKVIRLEVNEDRIVAVQ